MTKQKIQNSGTGTLFRNPVLEKLTRTHFLFPVILYYAISVLMMWIAINRTPAGFFHFMMLFLAGLLTFTLTEYLIHRFLFHFPANTEKQKKFQYTIHGVHHEFPKDKDRLVMPPVASILLALVFFLLFLLITGQYVYSFYSGFTFGYSTYLIIHYSVHRFKPPRNILRTLWKHHALHHYKQDKGNFSVSFPVWDFIFGSALRLNPKEQSEPLNTL